MVLFEEFTYGIWRVFMSEHLNFLRDPRFGLHGVSLLDNEEIFVNKKNTPIFSDDPFGLARKLPNLPNEIKIDSYVLEVDGRWTLDGQRFFFDKKQGFFCDQTFAKENIVDSKIISVDKSTSIQYKSNNFILDNEKIEKKKKVKINGRVGVALSLELSNWGSFLTRCMPKAFLLKKYNCDYIIAYCPLPQQYELIKMAGWDDSQIIKYDPNCNYVVDSWVYPS